jgi:nucleotide-binding universal stress UspA family protein
MREIKRILCPVDFSETSDHTIEQATALAGWYGAKITALHVSVPMVGPARGLPEVAGEPDPETARAGILTAFEAATDAGIPVDVVVRSGQAAQTIVDLADTLLPDVIVMGTHGTSGFQHLLLGSVTEKVLRRARCAVLTVPPRARSTSALPFARILCPVDFSEPSLAAFETAASLAATSRAALSVLYVIEWPWVEPPAPSVADLPPAEGAALGEFRRYIETSAMMRLDALVAGSAIEPRPTSMLRNGKAHVEILRRAMESRADLIVMGVHGRSGFDMALFGSTTNQVVRQATCPVMTLRQ